MSIEILGQTTLENGAVILRTTAGEFCGKDGGGRTAVENARELMLRQTSRYLVSVADNLEERNKGNATIWRGRPSYIEARDLAHLYMLNDSQASIVIIDNYSNPPQIMFTNREELCR